MKQFRSFVLLIFFLLGCASTPELTNSTSSDLCFGRSPAAAGERCESLFDWGPRTVGARPGKKAETRFDLKSFREYRLKKLNFTLTEALEVVAPNRSEVDSAKLEAFLKKVNASWDKNAIEAVLAKRTLSQRLFSKISKSPYKSSLQDYREEFRNLSEDKKVLFTEFQIYFFPQKFQGRTPEIVHPYLASLWMYGGQNVLAWALGQNISAASRRTLIYDYLAVYKELEIPISASHSLETIKNLEVKDIGLHLETILREEPKQAETKAFIEKIVETKKLTTVQLLTICEKQKLDQSNPDLWSDLLINALRASPKDAPLLALTDKWLSRITTEGEVKVVHEWLKSTAPARAAQLSENPKNLSNLIQPYFSLLGKSNTEASRLMVLQELLKFGPEAARAYVGADNGSFKRLQYLIKIEPKSEDAQKALENYFKKIENDELEAKLNSDRSLRATLDKKFPSRVATRTAESLKALRATDLNLEQIRTSVRDQDNVESSLDQALKSVIQANAPPEVFAKQARPWTAYLKSIPSSKRAEVVWQLLVRNGTTTAGLSDFISKLDAIEGVRDTVVRFLGRSNFMTSNRSDFSQEQVTKMFRGARAEEFFPYFKGLRFNGGIRTKFILAVRTSPIHENGLSVNWVREKLDSEEVRENVPAVLGYRPALGYDRLLGQLGEGFGTRIYKSPLDQARGLIVQGHYEKSGFSIMYRLNNERGQAQVEELVPSINRSIEQSLRQGVLEKQSPLVKRLFIKGWVLSSNGSLIESFRQRAIRMAARENGFWNLRVEIHNFPTSATLEAVKTYQANNAGRTRIAEDLELMIQELSQFLGISQGSDGLRSVVENRLPASAENRKQLVELLGNPKNEIEQLNAIAVLREKWKQIKDQSSSNLKEIERQQGEQILSESAVAAMTSWVSKIENKPISNRVEGFRLALESLERDGFLNEKEAKEWKSTLSNVTKDRSLNALERIEVVNQVLKGIVDQVYFKVSDEFLLYDTTTFQVARINGRTPLRFIDDLMRSGMAFALSKAVDYQAREIAQKKNIQHEIGGKEASGLVDVYNPGETIGVLRIGKNPMELSRDDIAVFDQMPGESAAVAGFITVGVGARLSHLQLLAKSLKIPNIQVSKDFLEELRQFDGKWVRYKADTNGRLVIELAEGENRLAVAKNAPKVKLPKANHDITSPIPFSTLRDPAKGNYAGPKGVTLAKLYQSGAFKGQVPDGVVLPFGFFDRYIQETGLKPLLEELGKVKLTNPNLVGALAAQIAMRIEATPIPKEMMAEVSKAVEELENRTGHKLGYFFRSDTNVEDLPNFNGAGLNESVPNVAREDSAMDQAIRRVWISPFSEKSIFWRGEALGRTTVTVAEPSVVIMPTIQVKSSGVLLTKGGEDWKPEHGSLSANFGIGSVVEAGRPVEEYSFQSGTIHRLSSSVSRTMPVAGENGGLVHAEVEPGTRVLTDSEVKGLNKMGTAIERVLGEQPHGWDVEWGINSNGQLIILQARPNM